MHFSSAITLFDYGCKIPIFRNFTPPVDPLGNRSPLYGIVLPLGNAEWTVFTWLPFLYGAGGELIETDRVDLANPGAIAVLEF